MINGAVTLGSGSTTAVLMISDNLGADNGTMTLTAAGTALTVANGLQIRLGIATPTLTSATFVDYWSHGAGISALDFLTSNPSEVAIWNVAPTLETDLDYLNLTGSLSQLSVGDRASLAYGDGSILVTDAGLGTLAYGQVFNLIDWMNNPDIQGSFNTGGFVGGSMPSAGDLDLPELSGGFAWDTSAFTRHGVVVVVPEASRVLLLFGGLPALFCRRRRPAP